MNTTDASYSLTTSLSYSPARSSSPFSLLPRHFARLRTAHNNLAKEVPEGWCARVGMSSEREMLAELERAVKEAQERGEGGDLRIRLNVLPTGEPFAEAFPLTPMPSYPVRLVFDGRPTSYDDPFLRSKTTNRGKYDEARARNGATLHPCPSPSAPPFDVILFNPASQVTETTISNVAFRFTDALGGGRSVTPRRECGLLEGVQRAELLEMGEVEEGVVTVEEVKAAVERGTLEIICFNGVRGVFKAYIAKGKEETL
ncbi:hypothetical protein JCM6882_002876 [Rhodosporidiobolus microsporus]